MAASAFKPGFLTDLTESAIGPYEPFAKAAGCTDGLAGRMALAFSLRNADPVEAEAYLVQAFEAWPIVCRVMAELEAAYPQHAGIASHHSSRVLEMLDRRDKTGDYG